MELKKDAGKQIEVGEDDGRIFELKERFESAGIIPHFWYIPSDTGFTTVALALDPESKDGSLLVYGAGAHSNPRIATIRAITEAAQSRLMQIENMRRDAIKAASARLMSYEAIKKRNRHWFEDKDKGKDKGEEEKMRLDGLLDLATDTIDGDVEVALEKLRRVVSRVIVVDFIVRSDVKTPYKIPNLNTTNKPFFFPIFCFNFISQEVPFRKGWDELAYHNFIYYVCISITNLQD